MFELTWGASKQLRRWLLLTLMLTNILPDWQDVPCCFMQQHGSFLQKGVSMTHLSGKKWLVKYGWCAHFQNSKGYFTTRWITFTIDNELKVDNKLLSIITSPSSIIVKVHRTTKVVLNVDDKVNKNDYDNDIKEEDIIDDESYKEKDEDEKNDDDEKVVRLTNMNE